MNGCATHSAKCVARDRPNKLETAAAGRRNFRGFFVLFLLSRPRRPTIAYAGAPMLFRPSDVAVSNASHPLAG